MDDGATLVVRDTEVFEPVRAEPGEWSFSAWPAVANIANVSQSRVGNSFLNSSALRRDSLRGGVPGRHFSTEYSCWTCGWLSNIISCLSNRFYYPVTEQEDDYLVYYSKDRVSPQVVALLIAVAALFSFVVSVRTRGTVSSALAAIPLLMWWSGVVVMHVLYKQSRRAVEEARRERTATVHETDEWLSDLLVTSPHLRVNAKSLELVYLWCNSAFYFGSYGFYMAAAVCDFGENACSNTLRLDGVIAVVFTISTMLFRLRFLKHAVHSFLSMVLMLVLRSVIPSSYNTPSEAFPWSVGIAFSVPAVLSCVSMWFVDRNERLLFQSLQQLLQQCKESQRITGIISNTASAIIPAAFVKRVARGDSLLMVLENAAVCCFGLSNLPQIITTQGFSASDTVEMLQCVMTSLDKTLEQLAQRIAIVSPQGELQHVKVHSMGDEHMFVVGSTDNTSDTALCARLSGSALSLVLEFVCCSLRALSQATAHSSLMFPQRCVSSGPSSVVAEENALGVILSHVAVAVNIGSVACLSLGMRNIVAVGAVVDSTHRLLRCKRSAEAIALAVEPSQSSGASLPHCGPSTALQRCVVPQINVTQAAVQVASLPTCPASWFGVVCREAFNFYVIDFEIWLAKIAANALESERSSQHSLSSDGSQKHPNPLAVASGTTISDLAGSSSGAYQANDISTSARSVVVIAVAASTAFDSAAAASSDLAFAKTCGGSDENQSSSATSFREPKHSEASITTRSVQSKSLSSAHELEQNTSESGLHRVLEHSVFTSFDFTRRLFIDYRFADDAVEARYADYVLEANEDHRVCWAQICMLSFGGVLVLMCVLSGTTAASSVREPFVWAVLTIVTSSISFLVAVTLGAQKTWTCALIRLLEVLYCIAYILIFITARGLPMILGYGQVFWFGLLVQLVVVREKRQGLLLDVAVLVLISAPFFWITQEQNPQGLQRIGYFGLFTLISFGAVVALSFLERFRREMFAATLMVESSAKRLAEDAGALETMLQQMMPNDIVRRLIAAVRNGNSWHARRGQTASPWQRLNIRTVWQSPFSTFTEDMPTMALRVHPLVRDRTLWGGSSAEPDSDIAAYVSALMTAHEQIDNMLLLFPGVVRVKTSGDIAVFAEQSASEVAEKSLRLLKSAVALRRSLNHSAAVEASVVMDFGTSVGAVLGQTSLAFEFYGLPQITALALLRGLPIPAIIGTTRFIQLAQSATRNHQSSSASGVRDLLCFGDGIFATPAVRSQFAEVGTLFFHYIHVVSPHRSRPD